MSPVDHLPWRDDRRRTTPELRAMTAAAYQAEERFVRWFGWHVFNQSHRFEDDRPETHLYFACPHDAERFKIGVSGDPRRRLVSLRGAAALDLTLYAMTPAHPALEKLVHEVLAADRLQGEWFRGSRRVLALAEVFLAAEQMCFDLQQGMGLKPAFSDTFEIVVREPREFVKAIERQLAADAESEAA